MRDPRTLKDYLFGIAIAFDEFWNSVLGGDPHATISARAYVAAARQCPWACVLCRLLDLLQRDHCRLAYEKFIAESHAET